MSETTPISLDEEVSAICSMGMQPLIMTGVLVQTLRQHFADRENIKDPILRRTPADSPGTYVWKSAVVETPNAEAKPSSADGLIIESATRWDPAITEARPGVFIRRNSWQPRRMGINSEHLGRPDPVGHRVFSQIMMGSHTLFCIGQTASLVEKLSYEVALELMEFGPVLGETLHLLRFAVAEIAGIGKIEEASDNFAVPITVTYAFEHTWQLRQHAPWLKRIILERQGAV